MGLLLELGNRAEHTNTNTNVTSKKMTLNDFLCGTQDAIAKGKVDESVYRIRRALSEMEIKKTTGK